MITEQTNEEQDADVQSFEQKLNKSDQMKDDPNISAETYRSKKEEKPKKQKVNSVGIGSDIKEDVKEDENPNNVSNLTELQKEYENQAPEQNDNLLNQLVDGDLNNVQF